MKTLKNKSFTMKTLEERYRGVPPPTQHRLRQRNQPAGQAMAESVTPSETKSGPTRTFWRLNRKGTKRTAPPSPPLSPTDRLKVLRRPFTQPVPSKRHDRREP